MITSKKAPACKEQSTNEMDMIKRDLAWQLSQADTDWDYFMYTAKRAKKQRNKDK
jgi:hypothetical protein